MAAAVLAAAIALSGVPSTSAHGHTTPVRRKHASAHHTKAAHHNKAAHHKKTTAKTWYVEGGAPAGGTGTQASPFNSLEAVQSASQPGQRVEVLPSTTPLGGGITLKPNQTLQGAGPSVRTIAAGRAAPVLENTTTNLDGDAVRLASGDTVENLAIGPTSRGGIYGNGVTGVTIEGNNVSHTNSSCTAGFIVAPFELPTLIPGVGAPFSTGLSNGWAAIMLDEPLGSDTATIQGNEVHNAQCADGIDVRAMDAAHVAVTIKDNLVDQLQEGTQFLSVLAIGLQTTGTSTLAGTVSDNTETYIGSAVYDGQGDADSEGLFANSAGRSTLTENATDNSFAHGLGHLSANCFEAAASNGGPTMHISLTHSTCADVVGDILEADNLSSDSTMTFNVDHVTAEYSTWFAGPEQAQVEPGDDGDCMLEVAAGAASSTDVQITNSTMSHCVADGLGVVSNVVSGHGPVKELDFSIENSSITDNETSNLRVANATPVDQLDGLIENTDMRSSDQFPILLENINTEGGPAPVLDFGGGPLGSTGGNCISGGGILDVLDARDSAFAEHNWWGQSGGPTAGRVEAVGGTVNSGAPLSAAPAACG